MSQESVSKGTRRFRHRLSALCATIATLTELCSAATSRDRCPKTKEAAKDLMRETSAALREVTEAVLHFYASRPSVAAGYRDAALLDFTRRYVEALVAAELSALRRPSQLWFSRSAAEEHGALQNSVKKRLLAKLHETLLERLKEAQAETTPSTARDLGALLALFQATRRKEFLAAARGLVEESVVAQLERARSTRGAEGSETALATARRYAAGVVDEAARRVSVAYRDDVRRALLEAAAKAVSSALRDRL